MTNRKILVLNIKNEESHYSQCLNFILSIEKKESKFQEKALKLAEMGIDIFVISPHTNIPNKIEAILSNDSSKFDISNFCKEDINAQKDMVSTIFHYHIRIETTEKFDYSQLISLALLLDRLKNLTNAIPANKEHRLTIIFKDSLKIFTDLSYYLRLLSHKTIGTVFAFSQANEIKALDFKSYVLKSQFFPLIPIDAETYNRLTAIFTESDFDELFNMRSGGRYRNSTNKNPNTALVDFIAEAAYYKLCEVYEGDKRILKAINRLISPSGSLLQFAIFSYLSERYVSLINVDGEVNKENFEKVNMLSLDVCTGIKQLIENVVQHSQFKSGFFHFNITQAPDGEKYLNIRISDFNELETMLDSYLSKIKTEMTLPELAEACEGLLAQRNDIALSQLFDINEDTLVNFAWREYRNIIKIKHFGLRIFNQALSSCQANFSVNSSTSFATDKKCQYLSGRKVFVDSLNINNHKIPGTDITIEIGLKDEKLLQSNIYHSGIQLDYFDESYTCFAKYLGYNSYDQTEYLRQSFINAIDNHRFDKTNSDLKEIFVAIWANSISEIKDERVHSNICHIVDLSRLYNVNDYEITLGNYEVFSRAIIRGLLFSSSKNKSFIAFINAPFQFIEDIRSQLRVKGGFCDMQIDRNLQLFLHSKNDERAFTLFGTTIQTAINNAFSLSLEHGLGIFTSKDYDKAYNKNNEKYEIFPFDAVIESGCKEHFSLFDKKIIMIAKGSLQEKKGYCINNHTRLGNKVHIDSFFEMSFLFYRTYIANRSAFQILRLIDISSKISQRIIYYGYASYSKAILTSLTEISRAYFKINRIDESSSLSVTSPDVSFIAYQHNLQTETLSDEIQLYYGFNTDKGKPIIDDSSLFIQIVPISTTLTTFNKMWEKFRCLYESKLIIKTKPDINCTVFWIDENNNEKSSKESILSNYIDPPFDIKIREVNVNNLTIPKINNVYYLMRTSINWYSPLGCEKCFPNDNDLMKESVLVETDVTSTVPAQQIRAYSISYSIPDKTNNERLISLLDSGCVSYGHFKRRSNHYQFYINTQKLFYQKQLDVKSWLEKLPKGAILIFLN